MVFTRRDKDAALRASERRRREDEAPRLSAVVPRLRALDISFAAGTGSTAPESIHKRRVVVERAPALFEPPCSNPSCKGGGHDITYNVLASLRHGEPSVSGEDVCRGSVGAAPCGWVLKYQTQARYEDA
ncbi:MAG: hypothetical protein U0234_25775 [Sandaracinus sp.]